MFVKFIDSQNVQPAPKWINADGKIYSNPTEETLRAHGYCSFVEQEQPSEPGYYYTFHYTTDGDTVYKVWDAHEIVLEPEPEPEPEPVIEENEEPVEESEPEQE